MKLPIGISPQNKSPVSQDIDMLKDAYKDRCDCCGIPSSGVDVFPLWVEENGWQNACELCYYSTNLDRIPSLSRGMFIFCPRLSQQEINVICRLAWSTSYHLKMMKVDIEVREAADTLNIIMARLAKAATDARSYFTSAIQNVESNIAYMNLMKDEHYNQRGLIYEHLRWLPEEDTFRESTQWYAKEVFNQVSVKHLQGQVDMFLTRISKG